MKKLILVFLLASLNCYSQSNSPTEQTPTAVATATAVATGSDSATPTKNTFKKMSFKQKVQHYWNKISNFDFQSLNIVGKTEKFVAAKKKQNLESMEGVETGIWKHTKRAPTSGAAKEIADKLDKTTQEKIKKYDSFDSY